MNEVVEESKHEELGKRMAALSAVAVILAADGEGDGTPEFTTDPFTIAFESIMMCMTLAGGAPEFFMEMVHTWLEGHDNPSLIDPAAPLCPLPVDVHARDIMVEMVGLMDRDKLENMREHIDHAILSQTINRVFKQVKGEAN